MVAGTTSNVGKTSISIGLMRNLKLRGFVVGAAKVGPDYIDPSFHRVATSRPSYNLDLFMTGAHGVCRSFDRCAANANLVVIEGVMGLFDGTDKCGIDDNSIDFPCECASNTKDFGGRYSTAAVAKLLNTPILLVLDARSMSHSVAAVVQGFQSNLPDKMLSGVILNRIKSPRHGELLTQALDSIGIRVLGAIPDGATPHFKSRHLGLIPTEFSSDSYMSEIDSLGQVVETHCNMREILNSFKPPVLCEKSKITTPLTQRHPTVKIGVAQGKAFSFNYQENLDILEEAGAELIGFDPSCDELPSEIDALIIGGGFPQLFGPEIQANNELIRQTNEARKNNMPIWAECGGMMWLAETIDGTKGVGIIASEIEMSSKLTLGYRVAVSRLSNLLFSSNETIYAHEFHYSIATPPGNLLVDISNNKTLGGFGDSTLFASYLHIHLAGNPRAKDSFIQAAKKFRENRTQMVIEGSSQNTENKAR